MEKGIIEAFEQVGRDVPPVTMGNPDQAGLAYWRDHQADGYHTAATAQPSAAGADAMFRVGMRILEGKGPKITSIVGNPPLTVDSDNLAAAQATFPDADVQVLDDWVKPDWTFDSAGVANPASGPTGTWLERRDAGLVLQRGRHELPGHRERRAGRLIPAASAHVPMHGRSGRRASARRPGAYRAPVRLHPTP